MSSGTFLIDRFTVVLLSQWFHNRSNIDLPGQDARPGATADAKLGAFRTYLKTRTADLVPRTSPPPPGTAAR